MSTPQFSNLPDRRTKSSVLRSFMGHKRAGSDGTALPATQMLIPPPSPPKVSFDGPNRAPIFPGFPMNAGPLSELQQNQQDHAERSPKKLPSGRTMTAPSEPPRSPEKRNRSPEKRGFSTVSLKTLRSKDPAKLAKSKENEPTSPKKTKSAANLVGLLSRPKSSKNLAKLADQDAARLAKDQENRTPPSSVGSEMGPPPPIYALFASQASTSTPSTSTGYSQEEFFGPQQPRNESDASLAEGVVLKQRPKSLQPPHVTKKQSNVTLKDESRGHNEEAKRSKPLTWGKGIKSSHTTPLDGLAGISSFKTESNIAKTHEPAMDPQDIEKHLEAMLDRRNIPENQRYKMRNLNNTIKMEFIRQDWAELQAKEVPGSSGGDSVEAVKSSKDNAKEREGRPKHTRGESWTLSRGKSKDRASSKKPKGEGTLGRHFRSRSTDSIASERPTSSAGSSTTSLLAKVKGQLTPKDFVQYLGKVQKPELVEVGKLHKLRLLLRNETVAWAEEFIRHGGMKEVVGLLQRIMDVEWREEHEDALLHENLLCLKALCTTALAVQYLDSIHATLFPALLHMLFDPEKKGPSDFTTRGIITSVLLTYIESAAGQERRDRAQRVLGYLRDPEGKEDDRPLAFVLEMRRERPYKVWCKEVVNVTKEVFWIFLHGLNVVYLPKAEKAAKPEQSEDNAQSGRPASAEVEAPASSRPISVGSMGDQLTYMEHHFPKERPPVPAAPYVGGVEWDATNYLASHLDLMNAIIACVPTREQRNDLRESLRMSGFERCMGVSLRTCKEKFYAAVHDGLRVWVAAAAEDGWDVKDVRFGPPADAKGSPKKRRAGEGNGKKKNGAVELAPKLEMPKLDLGL